MQRSPDTRGAKQPQASTPHHRPASQQAAGPGRSQAAAASGQHLGTAPAGRPILHEASALLASKLERDADEALYDFDELESALPRPPRNAASRTRAALENPDLNRYCDVLPFDANRVQLAPSAAAAPAPRYINASTVRDPAAPSGSPPLYLVAQAPVEASCVDFWEMVVQYRCPAIIMLTVVDVIKQRQCCEYFAARAQQSRTYGRFTVTTLDAAKPKPDLWRRKLRVRCADTGACHDVSHYQYVAWPDHGVPSSTEPILHLLDVAREHGAPIEQHAQQADRSEGERGPLVVHCSAGIGRSGVFCAVDIAARRLRRLQLAAAQQQQSAAAGDVVAKVDEAVDLRRLVAGLRLQRMGMVQTPEQYVYCHDVLLSHIDREAGALPSGRPHPQ